MDVQEYSQRRFPKLTRHLVFFIYSVHKRFRELRPDLVPRQMTEGQASSVKVPCECIEKMPELRENPFRRRICA